MYLGNRSKGLLIIKFCDIKGIKKFCIKNISVDIG